MSSGSSDVDESNETLSTAKSLTRLQLLDKSLEADLISVINEDTKGEMKERDCMERIKTLRMLLSIMPYY